MEDRLHVLQALIAYGTHQQPWPEQAMLPKKRSCPSSFASLLFTKRKSSITEDSVFENHEQNNNNNDDDKSQTDGIRNAPPSASSSFSTSVLRDQVRQRRITKLQNLSTVRRRVGEIVRSSLAHGGYDDIKRREMVMTNTMRTIHALHEEGRFLDDEEQLDQAELTRQVKRITALNIEMLFETAGENSRRLHDDDSTTMSSLPVPDANKRRIPLSDILQTHQQQQRFSTPVVRPSAAGVDANNIVRHHPLKYARALVLPPSSTSSSDRFVTPVHKHRVE